MTFLKEYEKKITSNFLNKGYFINKIENKKSLNYISDLILKKIYEITKLKKRKLNLNNFHKLINVTELNDIRLELIKTIANDKKFNLNYFNLARNHLYILAGNELMMQRRVNLSIQLPNDDSSLLPIHSDVWSGDSPYEINLWVPLVDCYNTKSMYILNQKDLNYFHKISKKNYIKNSDQIFKALKNKIKWISIKKGQFLIFNQSLPHGNEVNNEKSTRWSLNCRFKNLFSPYADKKIGEFFYPITTRAITKIGLNYKFPFK